MEEAAQEYKLDDQLAKKQAYIVVKILDAKQNVGAFADFLDTKKEGSGSDINILSLVELHQFVEEFLGEKEKIPKPPQAVAFDAI